MRQKRFPCHHSLNRRKEKTNFFNIQNSNSIMNFIEMLIPFFIFFIVIEVVFNLFYKKNFYSIPDTISDMSLGIISRLTDIFVLILMMHIYENISLKYSLSSFLHSNLFHFTFQRDILENIQALASWLTIFILLDFLFYWSHRFSHEINILWASHVAHHSSQEYNLTVALRQSFLRNAITLCFYMIFAMLNVPWTVLLLTDALNRFYQFWVHTRFFKRLPHWIEYLFVTPSHHRVHHARNPKYLDKNYAGVFIFWDRIFGTFEEEKEEPVYGIVKPLKTFNPIRSNLHVFGEMIRLFRSPISISLKFKAIISKPDYMSNINMSMPNQRSSTELAPKIHYVSLSNLQKIVSIVILIVLVTLSLALIRFSTKIDLQFALIFYFGLLGGYGLLGNYLDRKTGIGMVPQNVF